MKKSIIILLIICISAAAVYSQLSTSDYKKECTLINDDYTLKEPQYTYEIINWPNGTKENRTTLTGYKDVLVRRDRKVCNETVGIAGRQVDFKLQGYNCKNSTNTFYQMQGVFCDSCIDGNCDGICTSGETCCLIKDGFATCKNSIKTWNQPTKTVAVSTLK